MYCGEKVTKEQLGTGDGPAIKCGDVNSRLRICFKECVSFIDANLIRNPKYFEYGDLLISGVGSDKKTAGIAATYLGQQAEILGGMVYVVRHKQNPKFMAYIMSSRFCRHQIELHSCGGSVFNFFIRELKKIKVPLPPLETQEKIVDILEKLDCQITKLEKDIQELTYARQSQCKFLAEQIIS